MNRLIATVAVENTFFSAGEDYDYYVPAELEKTIKCGMRIIVPFGRNNIKRHGVIVKLFYGMNSQLKEICAVDKKTNPLSEEMVSLALWLKERCFCSTYECLRQMLPRGTDKIKDKSTKMIRLSEDNTPPIKLTPKQQSVYELLCDVGSAGVSEVCEFCSVGKGVLDNLVKYGICEYFEKEVYRTPYKNVSENGEMSPINLSEVQQNAFNTYLKMMDTGGTGLLYGVTGSGKTQVYLKLIDEAISRGKDVIVLVPEISLTPQMLYIFHSRYGKKVAVMHSGLSIGERTDEYKRADRGEAKIIVGTRSAVFNPVHNLGLIVMDEEQEHTYKSERTPRYNLRDVANFRCR